MYHDIERPWTLPLGVAANVGNKITGGRAPAGTSLRTLADVIIEQAMSQSESREAVIIGSKQMQTSLF